MVYEVALTGAFHDTAIALDDLVMAETVVGATGGGGGAVLVVADAGGVDSADVPPAFDAVIS